MNAPQVTAVIPTIGRPSLRRAVRSVQRQTHLTTALVVLDDPDAETLVRRRLEGLDYRMVVTPGRRGGSAARNMGVEHAETPLVAFLDDDDEWIADKTAVQTAEASQDRVEASRAMLVGSTSRIVPELLYGSDHSLTSMADYVLDRSTVRLSRHFLQTSTLLCSRESALKVRWDESLVRHQDWDWLIRLEAAGLEIRQHPQVLARVFQGSQGSISRTPDWQSSKAWIETLPAPISSRSAGDFTASVVARGAFASGAFREGVNALAQSIRSGAHRSALLVGISGLMSRGGYRG